MTCKKRPMRHAIYVAMSGCLNRAITQLAPHVLTHSGEQVAEYLQYYIIDTDVDSNVHIEEIVVVENEDKTSVFDQIDAPFVGKQVNMQVYDAKEAHLQLQNFFINRYQSTVTINNRGDYSELQYVLLVPLYEENAVQKVQCVLEAIQAANQPTIVEIIGISEDCSYLFASKEELNKMHQLRQEYKENQLNNLAKIMELRKTFNSLLKHVFFFQNCVSNGVSLDLDLLGFVRIIGQLVALCTEKYHDIYQGIDTNEDKLQIFGLSVLDFDKYYFVEYMLRRIFLDAMRHEHVDKDHVDVNKATNYAQKILKRNISIFNDLYKNEVIPRYKDHKSHNIIAEELAPIINEQVELLKKDSISYISSDDLDLPDKKAILSCLLGLDDALLTGHGFSEDNLIFDDIYDESVELFLNSNNRILLDSDRLIQCAQDKEIELEDVQSYAVLSPDGETIENPNAKLKKIRHSILQKTRYIRHLQDENNRLNTTKEVKKESTKIFVDDKVVINDHEFRLIPPTQQEVSLDETYVASGSPKAAVDMRGHMSRIKNQGSQGSCLAHVLVAVYEYLYGGEKTPNREDFSEAYLYYNARLLDGEKNKDEGCNFATAIHALVEHGLCKEVLCPYDDQTYSKKPSEVAYNDGDKRKLLVAKNVNLNEKDIKSALSDGYPIACSFTLYDSFSESIAHGLVPMPSKAEIEANSLVSNHSRHAMLLCGYDDKNKFFICRNSWGKDYGENGYCYLPYSYVLDERLTNFACIIEKVETEQLDYVTPDSQVQVDLKGTDIKIFINKSLITYTQSLLELDLQVRDVLQESYITLKQRLKDGSVHSALVKGVEVIKDLEIAKKQKEVRDVEAAFQSKLSNFDQSMSTLKATLAIYGAVVFCALCGLFYWQKWRTFSLFWDAITDYWYITAIVILGAVGLSLFFSSQAIKRKSMITEHKADLKDLNEEIHQLEEKKDLLRLRHHVAATLLLELFKIQTELENKNQIIYSYLGNLKAWLLVNEARDTEPTVKLPYIALLQNDLLDQFYESQKERLAEQVKLWSCVENYGVDAEQVKHFQIVLKEKLSSIISERIEDFNMYECITGAKKYPYVKSGHTELSELIPYLYSKSDLFARLRMNQLDVNNIFNMIFLHVDGEDQMRHWKSVYPEFFPPTDKPDSLGMCSRDRIVMMRIVSTEMSSLYDVQRK